MKIAFFSLLISVVILWQRVSNETVEEQLIFGAETAMMHDTKDVFIGKTDIEPQTNLATSQLLIFSGINGRQPISHKAGEGMPLMWEERSWRGMGTSCILGSIWELRSDLILN